MPVLYVRYTVNALIVSVMTRKWHSCSVSPLSILSTSMAACFLDIRNFIIFDFLVFNPNPILNHHKLILK